MGYPEYGQTIAFMIIGGANSFLNSYHTTGMNTSTSHQNAIIITNESLQVPLVIRLYWDLLISRYLQTLFLPFNCSSLLFVFGKYQVKIQLSFDISFLSCCELKSIRKGRETYSKYLMFLYKLDCLLRRNLAKGLILKVSCLYV